MNRAFSFRNPINAIKTYYTTLRGGRLKGISIVCYVISWATVLAGDTWNGVIITRSFMH